MNKHLLFLTLAIALLFAVACKTESLQKEDATPPKDFAGIKAPRGLIKTTEGATPGFVVFSPLLSSTTYLINNKGEVVHRWESQFGPSGWVYLKENGNLLRGGRDPQTPVFDGGGQGGWIQEFNWEGEIVWEYKLSSTEYLAHHDVAIMPNGNILAIAWEAKTVEETVQAGRKPEMIPQAGLWPDVVLELEPQGKNEAKVVWKWHIWDHLIQNYDKSKDNYGDPAVHPELLDLNIGNPLRKPVTKEELDKRRASNNATTNDTPENQGSDVYHLNAINYNAELDQIALSSPSLDEIFIIDHSTSTEEAASHEGGRWGKGGDFLYRWGNPQNYHQGDSTHQKLGGQHDIKWIAKGVPGAGNLLLFNNQVPGAKPPYSSVLELKPPLEPEGYRLDENGRFGPEEPTWTYIAKDTTSFFGPFISGAQRLFNGNTFITEGPRGRFFEVNSQGDILWEYWTPFAGYMRGPDGTTPQPVGPFTYATFRAMHLPTDHPALAGKNLEALNPQPAAYQVEDKKSE